MINFTDGDLIPLTKVWKNPLLCKPGETECRTRGRLQRWITRGVGGVKIETIKIGKRRYTSLTAIRKFIQDCNAEPQTVNVE